VCEWQCFGFGSALLAQREKKFSPFHLAHFLAFSFSFLFLCKFVRLANFAGDSISPHCAPVFTSPTRGDPRVAAPLAGSLASECLCAALKGRRASAPKLWHVYCRRNK